MGGTIDGAIASFDIFDTILTRRVGNPGSAFLLLGRRAVDQGIVSCSAHAFANARRRAEVRAFKNAGGLDSAVRLRDIYVELSNAMHLPERVITELCDLEMELELEILVPMPNGVRLLDSARARGERVIFVSDMYLSSAFLRMVLDRHGLLAIDDEMIVSNEQQRSKATGTLWPHVLRQLGVPATAIHHTGNDERSDGRNAQRSGIRATVLEESNLNRYELILETHSEATDGLSSALAGASRLARLEYSDTRDAVIAEVAAGVVAPFVVGNLLWTLGVAKREGLSNLFFVARDGQLLCDVASVLADRVGYDGELTYVYGSRQAWSLASITDQDELAFEWMVGTGHDVASSLRTVLSRFEMEPESVAVSLQNGGFGPDRWDLPLTEAEGFALADLLRTNAVLREGIRSRAKESRERVLDYLDSAGAITDQPIGFVDLGTGASLFNSLSAILATVGQDPPLGFYFGLRSHLPESRFGRPLTYIRNESDGVGYLRTPGFLTFVELACTADHGSVLGYEDVDGDIRPVFATDGNAAVVEWGLPIVRRTVRRVAEELLLDESLVGADSIDLRPSTLDVFQLFWTDPSRREAEVWGSYPFEDGWGERAVRHPIAERRRLRDVVRSVPHRHWWDAGANQLSGAVTRAAFEGRRAAEEFNRKVRTKL